MSKLIGKVVGDLLVEYIGPIEERNFNINGGSPTPTITVQLFGTGSVLIEETQTPIIQANAGTNAFTYETRPDQTTWAVVTTVVGNTPAITVPVTSDATFAAIRATVAAVGDGKLVIQSNWV